MCENTGKDMAGKDILVGEVPGGLMATAFPMQMRCAFWCVLSANNAPKGTHKLSLQLREKDKPEKKIIEITIEFSVPETATGTNAFSTPSSAVTIKEPMTSELL